MSRDLPLTVAAALTVPPLDLGSVVAGQRGLTREVLWVDIMHAPAESFVRAGDLVLTTGADARQPGVLDFLTYVVTSAAAGVVISPPPDAAVDDLLVMLAPYAEQNDFPVVVLPWEVAFSARGGRRFGSLCYWGAATPPTPGGTTSPRCSPRTCRSWRSRRASR